MWIWVRRVGLIIMIASSIVIGFPIIQYEICNLNLGVEHKVISVNHCSYFVGRVEILLLVFGNILFGIGYSLERIRNQR